MVAAQTGNQEAVRALIAAGANTHAQDQEEKTALMYAAEKGHEGIVKALIAAGNDNDDVVIKPRELVRVSADPRKRHTGKGGTKASTTRVLGKDSTSKGAKERNGDSKARTSGRGVGSQGPRVGDCDARDRLGRTALMYAAHGGHPAAVQALITAGADVNAQELQTPNRPEPPHRGTHHTHNTQD